MDLRYKALRFCIYLKHWNSRTILIENPTNNHKYNQWLGIEDLKFLNKTEKHAELSICKNCSTTLINWPSDCFEKKKKKQ